MNSPSLDRYADHFERLSALPPSEREAALAALSLNDDDRAVLRRLLDADADIDDPLARTLAAGATRLAQPRDDRFGPYRLIRELGSGGMGTVFLAERVDGGFAQAVAIKLLRGFPTVDGLRRLRRERQILATLDHPHIARLLDGGETGDGQPWLALEYVDGLPLFDYAARHAPRLRERLALFDAMLDAVAHAHRHLVIHRDLKPANVLVNAAGEVKLLDFGIARLVDADTADARETSTRVFSLGYASPEQRGGHAITTASDIYSLGVLLRELVAGSPKLPALPPLPFDTELAGIVAKATDDDPSERYASAGEFRDDLDRYRSGRPVRAARMTRAYRLRKFVGRHRVAVGAGFAALLMLALFVWRLDRERNRALAAEASAQQAQQSSERDAASARAALEFMTNAFKAAAPENALSRQVSVRDLLDAARHTLERTQADAKVQHEMQRLLARLYGSLGEAPIALELMRDGLADDTPSDVAHALRLAADYDEYSHLFGQTSDGKHALEAARKAAALREHYAPDDAIEHIRSLHALALAHHRDGADAQAIPLLRDAYERSAAAHPPLDLETDIEQSLAALLATNGDCEEAQAVVARGLARIAAETPGDAPTRITLLRTQGSALTACGEPAKAEPVLREAIGLHKRIIGDGGSGMMELTNELALALNSLGRYREAVEMMRRSDAAMTAAGLGGVDAAISLENYAGFLESAGDYVAALDVYRKTEALYDDDHVDADHQQRRRMERSYARTLALAGDPAHALERLDRLRERAAALDGTSSVEYALVSWQRMLVERQLRRPELGLARLDEVESLWRALVPSEHPIFAHVHRYRGAFAAMQGNQVLARRELEAALATFDANGALPVDVAVTRGELAAVALAQGRRDEARELLGKALPVLRDALLPGEINRAAAEHTAAQLGVH